MREVCSSLLDPSNNVRYFSWVTNNENSMKNAVWSDNGPKMLENANFNQIKMATNQSFFKINRQKSKSFINTLILHIVTKFDENRMKDYRMQPIEWEW